MTYLSNRAALDDAVELLRMFGDHADMEALARADRSRIVGNIVHFCHWRQIGHAIAMLREEEPSGTVH